MHWRVQHTERPMKLNRPTLNVLALAYYGQPIWPPTTRAKPTWRDKRGGISSSRSSIIKLCKELQLIDYNNKLTDMGRRALLNGGKI